MKLMRLSAADRPPKAVRYNFSTPFEHPSWGTTQLLRCMSDTSEPPPPPRRRVVIRLPYHGNGKGEAAPPASPLALAPEEHRNLTTTPDGNQRNLRTRTEVRDPTEIAGPSSSPVPPVPVPSTSFSLRPRSKEAKGKAKMWEFSIMLTREQIEADLYVFTRSKPPRNPKRRPKFIQENLDDVFPGLSLPSTISLPGFDR